MSYFVFLYQSPSSSPSSSLSMVFDSISSNIDEVLSIKSSANVFVFEDFNVHYKDWLTFILGSQTVILRVCSFGFISSDASICSTMAFPPLGNSDHVVYSVSIFTKEKNILILRKSSDRLVIIAKEFLKLPNFHMLISKRAHYFPETCLVLVTSGELLIVFSTKVNLLYLLCYVFVKEKLFAENFSMNSNLDDSGISLPVFPSRTKLELHNILVTPKMVRKVAINLDLSKAS